MRIHFASGLFALVRRSWQPHARQNQGVELQAFGRTARLSDRRPLRRSHPRAARRARFSRLELKRKSAAEPRAAESMRRSIRAEPTHRPEHESEVGTDEKR